MGHINLLQAKNPMIKSDTLSRWHITLKSTLHNRHDVFLDKKQGVLL